MCDGPRTARIPKARSLRPPGPKPKQMSKTFLEVRGLDQTKTLAVDDISTIIKDGDHRTFIDMKTPLAGVPGSISRIVVDKPYEKVLANLKDLGATIVSVG